VPNRWQGLLREHPKGKGGKKRLEGFWEKKRVGGKGGFVGKRGWGPEKARRGEEKAPR